MEKELVYTSTHEDHFCVHKMVKGAMKNTQGPRAGSNSEPAGRYAA